MFGHKMEYCCIEHTTSLLLLVSMALTAISFASSWGRTTNGAGCTDTDSMHPGGPHCNFFDRCLK